MIVDISTSEVLKLTHILFRAYLNENKKYYAINEEPLYSYSEEKRNAKKERQQCIVNEGMYLDHYHYWDCLIGHIRHPQIPYIEDIGTVDIDFDEVIQTQILLHDMLLESNTGVDITELSSSYNYWVCVSKENDHGHHLPAKH